MKMAGQKADNEPKGSPGPITLFMCGDVMTGRGIDQVLPHPSDPRIHEPYVKNAKRYVEIAERANGPIQRPVSFSYIWGEALKELERVAPDLRIINLETSVTRSGDYWRGKGINYRMHPDNIPCITAARIDFCSLANNHVLDWGYSGLRETLETLKKAGVRSAGAGQNLEQAETPAVMMIKGKGRVILFSFGSETSGIPFRWAVLENRPGVNLLRDFSDRTVGHIKDRVKGVKKTGDIVVASIHWGGNWGYTVPYEQRAFAHKLIDIAGVDLIHGHSSHHVKGVEVYKGKLIIYGCGDFINDYEGIGGYKDFRDDLSFMYFAGVSPANGRLVSLHMTPTRSRNFRLNRPEMGDTIWLKEVLNREGKGFGTRARLKRDGTLTLKW